MPTKGKYKVIRIVLLCQLLSLSVCAQAAGVYNMRQLSEPELIQTYTNLMIDACRHSNKNWHVLPSNPNIGYWGDGVSNSNEGVRAVGESVLTYSALLKYCDSLSNAQRKDFMAKTIAATRYMISTHVTGTDKCVDGKQWGKNWQSAMWTGTWAMGVWLVWDELDADLRDGAQRVITFEADRFLSVKPPTNRWGDTKAEENAWDLLSISAALNMFPEHPHSAAWREKAIEYTMNTLSVPRDLKDDSIVDGKPVREWVHGANLNPDFTLENHNIFHPAYVACSTYMLGQSVMYYKYGGNNAPEAVTRHIPDVWGMFQAIMPPWGEPAYPQGVDWEQHGVPAINLEAFMATYMHNSTAAAMESAYLQHMQAWQEQADGDMMVPGSKLGFCRHAICAEQATWGFLSHKIFGPSDAAIGATIPAESFVKRFSSVDVVLHRTPSKLMTMSWKNRIMGMIMPLSVEHENNPFFTVPLANGFVGSFELNPVGDVGIKVVERTWKRTASGFETSGVLLTNGGRLRQRLKISSIGEKIVVFQDEVRAETDVSVARELGVPVGIENDSITGGKRVIYYDKGQIIADWQKPSSSIPIGDSKWINVDGRLGVVSATGSGLNYVQATGYNGQAVYCDVLYGSFSNTARSFKAGEEVARRVIIFAVDVTQEDTAVLARSIKIGTSLSLTLPEGGEVEVTLLP